MIVRKLDPESLKRWEETLGAQQNPPSFADLEKFLVSRIYTLEALERTLPRNHQANSNLARSSTSARAYTSAVAEQKRALCGSGHYLSSCQKYLEKSPEQRREIITSKNLCFNCLGLHRMKACRNTKRCCLCRKQHHTTLHPSNTNTDVTPAASSTTPPSAAQASTSQSSVRQNETLTSRDAPQISQTSSHIAQSRVIPRTNVLLAATAVTVLSRHGQPYPFRALLDQGSEVSFISEFAAQALHLSRRSAAVPILGIGAQRNLVSKGLLSLTMVSRINTAISFNVDALVLAKLTAYLPPAQLEYCQ